MDDRLGTGLSVDRLGMKQTDQDVVGSVLVPLASAMGVKRNLPFTGWAQLPVSEIKMTKVEATPPEGEDNPYHAEINRDDCDNTSAAYFLAFMLSVIAGQHEFIPSPDFEPDPA